MTHTRGGRWAASAASTASLLIIALCAWGAGRCGAQEPIVFRAGAVLTERGHGPTDEMQEAREGYELFAMRVGALHDGRGFRVVGRDGGRIFFKFRFESRDDGGAEKRHRRELRELLHRPRDPVHFVFGSHPEFAESETRICEKAKRLNYHCCVGPEEIYRQGHKYVFGVTASNTKYPELALRSMALKGLKSLAVIHRSDNVFTRTTCEYAITLANERFMKQVGRVSLKITDTYNITEIRESLERQNPGVPARALEEAELRTRFQNFAMEAKRHDVEGVVACGFTSDGRMLVEAFNEEKYPLKSFFLTVGPTKKDWILQTNNSAYMLSAVQWHRAQKYTGDDRTVPLRDDLFGTPKHYVDYHNVIYAKPPTYLSAGASAVGLTLMLAINETFSKCNLAEFAGSADDLLFGPPLKCRDGRVLDGYERIRLQLKELDQLTFFGHVRFNKDQRNIGMDPVTTQVLGDTDECEEISPGELGVEAVLPLDLANRELRMPACNPFRTTCRPGQMVPSDIFASCRDCYIGTFSVGNDSDHCDSCPPGMYNNRTGQSKCKVCPENTHTLESNRTSIEDCVCKLNFFEPRNRTGHPCLPCPDGARCDGNGAWVEPLKGYWVAEDVEERSTVYECSLRSACPGEGPGQCREGHAGRMCDACQKGYFYVFDRCFRCISKRVLTVLFVFLIVGWYMLNVVISKSLPSVDILLSWAQLANVIGDLDLSWPLTLEIVFGVANLMDFDVDIMEPTCFYSDWSYEDNFFVQLCLPFIMGFFALIGYLVASLLKFLAKNPDTKRYQFLRMFQFLQRVPRSQAELDAKWDMTVAAFLSSIEVTYITIAKYCFDAFKCRDVHGVMVLCASPEIECGSSKHNVVRGLAAAGILFYVIGFPLWVSWRLSSLRSRQAFADPVALRRYGFLYRRYELEYFWTGLVVLVRRVLFVLVLVFVHNAAFQVALLAAIIICSLMLHVYSAPYVDTYLDWLFSILLISLLIECFGGLMFYADNLPNANKGILEVFVLSGLFLLVAVFVYTFVREMKKKVEILEIRRMHCRAVLNKDVFEEDADGTGRWERKTRSSQVSRELTCTFNPNFVYKALKDSDEEMLLRWDKLSDMLKEYMADRSETSYLSLKPVAKFWRKLVERFPELIDFLTVADEDTRNDFKSFATKLYNDFYLKKNIESAPIFRVLNWRDRAPLAQWLAMAEEKDLVFFREFMVDMYRAAKFPGAAEDMEMKIRDKGGHELASPDEGKAQHFPGRLARLCGWNEFVRVLSNNTHILEEINEKRGPLRHTAKKQIMTQAMVVTAAAKFRAASKRGAMEKKSGAVSHKGDSLLQRPQEEGIVVGAQFVADGQVADPSNRNEPHDHAWRNRDAEHTSVPERGIGRAIPTSEQPRTNRGSDSHSEVPSGVHPECDGDGNPFGGCIEPHISLINMGPAAPQRPATGVYHQSWGSESKANNQVRMSSAQRGSHRWQRRHQSMGNLVLTVVVDEPELSMPSDQVDGS
ncbi:unnamed protein product [Ostreobium quekettii]|uniref:Tyrosine-protein kinase ephrin type A/B receptor-like domain-containing protein n=1 Tax=Ostreobium quekettii TaxID=121088 RepID=A0A8S1IKY5_9CHLO|nr:unnamed protein product [Ostreobium quekettii]|eukprot:evm.model.scf_57.10 EVM.evm.TU.scf_57.10   scf_57:82603-91996(-)